MIILKDLVKVYGKNDNKVEALKKINLEIKDGEMVAIMGPSGRGKSTLLNILGCVDKQTSGNYMLDDIEISKLSYDELADIRNEKIGFILQNFALINDFTVIE